MSLCYLPVMDRVLNKMLRRQFHTCQRSDPSDTCNTASWAHRQAIHLWRFVHNSYRREGCLARMARRSVQNSSMVAEYIGKLPYISLSPRESNAIRIPTSNQTLLSFWSIRFNLILFNLLSAQRYQHTCDYIFSLWTRQFCYCFWDLFWFTETFIAHNHIDNDNWIEISSFFMHQDQNLSKIISIVIFINNNNHNEDYFRQILIWMHAKWRNFPSRS